MPDAYRALKGFNTSPCNRRVNPGEVVDDLTAKQARALTELGAIEKVPAPAPKPQAKR